MRTPQNAYVCGIHWQVAQGTSLENMVFYMSQDEATTQQLSISSLKLQPKNLYLNFSSGSIHGKRQWWLHYQLDIRWWQLWVIPPPEPTACLRLRLQRAYFGNQQFTTSEVTFINAKNAFQVHWDWAWTMQDVIIENCVNGLVIVGGVSFAFIIAQHTLTIS